MEVQNPLKDFKGTQDLTFKKWEKARKEIDSEERPLVTFIEGPPTMNGEPHIGHVRGRVIKDLFYRMEVLKGNKVFFRAGWDTQGLPVELEAEKELGITGNKYQVLNKIGEDKLVAKCKELIHNYNKIWRDVDKQLGLMFDYDKAYWTYKDEYIEREWKIIKAAYEKGLLYEDYRVVAYCPSCQTSLSNSEVALGYKEETDPSMYYKVKLTDEDLYLIVWTTMPFTLVTDEAVAVNPDENYLIISVKGEKWIVGSTALNSFLKETGIKAEVVGKIKGKELEGKRYVPALRDLVPAQDYMFTNRQAYYVFAEDFVDVTTGTGIVHLSPANGEEDFEVGKKRGLPVFNPIDDQVKFTDQAGKYAGLFVRDADEIIAKDLESKGVLVKYGKIKHIYPTCWRSGHKLVFLARREYFYDIPKIADKAYEEASKVQYYFDQPRNRFLEIIKEKKPWCISRERVWGTPLPVWVCKNCGNKIYLFSREEIIKNAIKLPDGSNFELHKPWIDRIVIRCPKCGGEAYREPFVLDTWHNSGAAPYASLTEEEYKKVVPVTFLTEGIDQTRGWAYTLLMEGVIFNERSPYKSFLFTGLIVDEKGEKMSKSKGNVVYARDLFNTYPSDLVRFYLIWKANPVDVLSYDRKEMMERPFQVLNTLYNLHIYYKVNSEYDGFIWEEKEKGELTEKELWILGVLQKAKKEYIEAYEKKRLNDMARIMERFIIEDFSQKYVPMIRNELWNDNPETETRRFGIYWTLGKVLRELDILLHPLAPYTTDYLFENIFGIKNSLLKERLPAFDEKYFNKDLIEKYEKAWDVVSLINSARMKAKIKRRWPLSEAIIFSAFDLSDEVLSTISQIANIKTVHRIKSLKEIPLEAKIRPIAGELGKLFKKDSIKAKELIESSNPLDIAESIIKEGQVKIDGFTIPYQAVEIQFVSKPGYEISWEKGLLVVINLQRDKDLIEEGYLKDVARRIQYARKEKGYNPTDILEKVEIYSDDEDVINAVAKRLKELSFLTRVKNFRISSGRPESGDYLEYELDEKKIYIRFE
ncbi:MAG: isoleucine--tRNA ligase [Nitrososphaeria archaeon]|nr:isoleucine--tRNA ligase [Conexivisphaerales archaeon]